MPRADQERGQTINFPRFLMIGNIREAVDTGMVQRVLWNLTRQPLEGDVAAVKVLLDRVLGNPRKEATGAAVAMPEVTTAMDVAVALRRVLATTSGGEVSLEDAARYAAVEELTRSSIETAEFEERQRQLEGRDAS